MSIAAGPYLPYLFIYLSNTFTFYPGSPIETVFCVTAGVKVTLSALIDGKNFNAGGHKVGMGFELEA